MSSTRIVVATLLGLSLVACDGDEGGRPSSGVGVGGKADDADAVELDPEIQAEHLRAVGDCESTARRQREHTSALRYHERSEIELDRAGCVADANDGVRSALALTLQQTAPEQASEVDVAFDTWRSVHTKLCGVLLEAHPLAAEKAIVAVESGCWAEAELRLAEAVEAFADLGGARAAAPDASVPYAACVEAFEADRADPDLGPDGASEIPEVVEDARLQAEVEAYDGLVACIDDVIFDAIPDLADRIVQSYPGRDVSQVEQSLLGELQTAADEAGQTCQLLGYAAADGGPLSVQACRVATAQWRHELLGYVIPVHSPAG